MPNGNQRPHIRVEQFCRSHDFKPPRRSIPGFKPPQRDRQTHGQALLSTLHQIEEYYRNEELPNWLSWDHVKEHGIVVEIDTPPGAAQVLNALSVSSRGLQLLVVHSRVDTDNKPFERQVWYVPDGKLLALEKIIETYLQHQKKRDFTRLVESISSIRRATIEQLWVEKHPWPQEDEPKWFEIWLRAAGDVTEDVLLTQFKEEAKRVGMEVGDAIAELREHWVVMAKAKPSQFAASSALLVCISEIHDGYDYAAEIEGMNLADQTEWNRDLQERIQLPDDSLAICLLDTGVNRGHPTLDRALDANDNLTIKTAWGAFDDQPNIGHGTPMAGLALLGNVSDVLMTTEVIMPPAILEGVKIVPPPTQRNNDEKNAAAYTDQGISTAQINKPMRKRIYCLATSMDDPADGRPTAWSSKLDDLAFNGPDPINKRLICVAAGNVLQEHWPNYPTSNFGIGIPSPGQAWNVLTIGAFTDRTRITSIPDSDAQAVAEQGSLSPSSRTSRPWDEKWPYKPDVVFEGGNALKQDHGGGTLRLPELDLLSTCADFRQALFCSFNATSAAAAQAAYFTASLCRQFPRFWPETIRGLTIHSAEWTDRMRSMTDNSLSERERAKQLLRTVGYGSPSHRRAIESATSRVTLIAQNELQPFKQEKSVVSSNEMHSYSFPWARGTLLSALATTVRLRITLSYFIEPNPGNRGYATAYRYAGCQLRFRVNQPGQDLDSLVHSVSQDEQAQENQPEIPRSVRLDPSRGWLLGANAMTRGSVLSDIWEGSAADLSDMQHLVVYPQAGWWRYRPALKRTNAKIRYSLLVTIESTNPDLDIYTEIASQIPIPISV